jgi:hypothetical protein
VTAPPIRGIVYDVGVLYEGDQPSRPHWRAEDMRRDLAVIADELACNAVMITGTDLGRLAEAGAVARERGLFAWLQPRLFDADQPAVLEHLERAACWPRTSAGGTATSGSTSAASSASR